MSGYEPMAIHLETERLNMQPWAEPDARELCVLIAERGGRASTVELCREAIALPESALAVAHCMYIARFCFRSGMHITPWRLVRA
jgi:hypothetical protein